MLNFAVAITQKLQRYVKVLNVLSLRLGVEEIDNLNSAMDKPPEASNSEVVENGALEQSDDAKEDVQKTEIVVLQDLGFTINIHAPGVEPFELQVCVTNQLTY